MHFKRFQFGCVILLLAFQNARADNGQWPIDKAIGWYKKQSWPIGCVYIPRTAVNQLEMWQADTFDAKTMDQELGWAKSTGFNAVRVFLHNKAWETDPDGFRHRIQLFLRIADRHDLRTVFVFFNDDGSDNARAGKQPVPKVGVYKTGWLQSPGDTIADDPSKWEPLQKYVVDIVGTFGKDKRVLMWDMYDLPGLQGRGDKSLPLLKQSFAWARSAKPSQPVVANYWQSDKTFMLMNQWTLSHSDIIGYESFNAPAIVRKEIADLEKERRPIICEQFMARNEGNTIAAVLPFLRHENIGAFSYGFVAGKTMTTYMWGQGEGAPPPKIWQNDLLNPDGSPFDPAEIQIIKSLAGVH